MTGGDRISYVEGLLVRSRGLSSSVIEWWGAGHWSHWANVLPGRRSVLDARYDKPLSYDPSGRLVPMAGVRMRPASYLEPTERLLLRIPCTDEQRRKWITLGQGQIGKPYDPSSILALVTGENVRRDWRDPSCWFCSELGVWMSEGAGITRPLAARYNDISPGAAGLVWESNGARVMAHLKPGEPLPLVV